jgi:type III restriction enzyme
MQTLSPSQVRIPPVLIIVCDNTDIAEIFYRFIAGEEIVSAIDVLDEPGEDDAPRDEEPKPTRSKRAKSRISYGHGKLFPEYFENRPGPGGRRTLRIDSKLLAEAETEAGGSKQKAAEELRRIVATVGRPGEPGEHIRCVVSVGMLTEGWDANNVTHILGLRAFGSQLLSEQVVGRGLRRMDYTVDPETGLLSEEYVDVYGNPFSVIPYRGNPVDKPLPQPKPKQHVRALPERAGYEIRFPVVEGYAFALKRNIVRADIGAMDVLEIEPEREPTAVFVKPQVGYSEGRVGAHGPGRFEHQDREEFYASTHLNQIAFEIARQVVGVLVGDYELPGGGQGKQSLRLQSRHQLFPQVLRLTLAYIDRKVRFKGEDPRELGLERYVRQLIDRLIAAIEPDAAEGEPPLLPILNRYQRWGTTADVDFKTITPCFPAERSHLNLVQADTSSWEQSAAFRLEMARDSVAFYARNEGLDFAIPYDSAGGSHRYEPDFLVRLTDRTTLILEIKGHETNEDRAKYEAARRWVRAVNAWGEAGPWAFHVSRDPHMLAAELRQRFSATQAAD